MHFFLDGSLQEDGEAIYEVPHHAFMDASLVQRMRLDSESAEVLTPAKDLELVGSHTFGGPLAVCAPEHY